VSLQYIFALTVDYLSRNIISWSWLPTYKKTRRKWSSDWARWAIWRPFWYAN